MRVSERKPGDIAELERRAKSQRNPAARAHSTSVLSVAERGRNETGDFRKRWAIQLFSLISCGQRHLVAMVSGPVDTDQLRFGTSVWGQIWGQGRAACVLRGVRQISLEPTDNLRFTLRLDLGLRDVSDNAESSHSAFSN